MRQMQVVNLEVPMSGTDVIVVHPIYVEDEAAALALIAHAKDRGLRAEDAGRPCGYLSAQEAIEYVDKQASSQP